MVNLSAFIRFHAERTPDKAAVIYDDRSLAYAEMYNRIERVAAALAARGIGRGDVVAAVMKNSPAFLEIAFAASHLGAVFLPINFRLAADEVGYITDNAEARLAFVDEEFTDVVPADLDHVILDPDLQADASDLDSTGAAVPSPSPCVPGDLQRLVYTSGTTDRPKGVMLSYENFYWKSMDLVMGLGIGAEDRLLVVGPLYHVGAFDLPGVAVLWAGGTLLVEREFDAGRALDAIARHRLTGAWMAPTMLNACLNLEGAGERDLASLRWIVGGGERTPESRIRQFGEVFRAGRYVDAYGLTESCSGDTLMEAGREFEKIGSTGRALAHVEVEIANDDGNLLPPGTEGEIVLRGPKVTKGYWKDPAKTDAAFFDGWFRTGDIGYLDDDRFLYLTDRKKDMILSGGENIASSEVERVIYELPHVLEAAVIGLPDAEWGERPVAVVVTKPGEQLDLETLREHCRAHLAAFKVPKELHFAEALPRNPSGKVLKRQLRENLASADD